MNGYPVAAYRSAKRAADAGRRAAFKSAVSRRRLSPRRMPALKPLTLRALRGSVPHVTARAAAWGGVRVATRAIPYIGWALLALDLLLLYQAYRRNGMHGWTIGACQGPPGGVLSSPGSSVLCGATGQGPQKSAPVPGATSVREFVDNGPYIPTPGWRIYTNGRNWTIASPGYRWPHPFPWVPWSAYPYADELPGNYVPPWIDPMATPPLAPTPAPWAPPMHIIPRRVDNPMRVPSERTVRGPVPVRLPRPAPVPRDPDLPAPAPGPAPSPGPGAAPAPGRPLPPDLPPSDDGPARPRYRRKEWQKGKRLPRVALKHGYRVPPKGVKERKLRSPMYYHAIMRVIDTITETNDVVQAVWNALPKKRRMSLGFRNPTEKAWDIYRFFHEIDLEVAIKELVANQIEDMAYGLFGKTMGKAARARGDSIEAVDKVQRALRNAGLDPVGELLDALNLETGRE